MAALNGHMKMVELLVDRFKAKVSLCRLEFLLQQFEKVFETHTVAFLQACKA